MTNAEVDKWFKDWCKTTHRNGGILVGSSIKELLYSLNGKINNNQSLPDSYYKGLTSFNKWSHKNSMY